MSACARRVLLTKTVTKCRAWGDASVMEAGCRGRVMVCRRRRTGGKAGEGALAYQQR